MNASLYRIICLASPSIQLKIHMGPVQIEQIAREISKTGFPTTAGTEHIYVTMPFSKADLHDAKDALLDALRNTFGKTFGIIHRDIQPNW